MTGTTQAFSVHIFIPGDPEGLRIIEKDNWIGQGIFFPKAVYKSVKNREELSRTGVYILWNPDPMDLNEVLPVMYVGKTEDLRERLNKHASDPKFEFWSHTVAFTSKDQSLNKAHIRYVEAELHRMASKAKLSRLENTQNPQGPALSAADAAFAELFLKDLLLCLPLVGVDYFELSVHRAPGESDLRLEAKGIKARGYEDAKGFIVLANSQVVKSETKSIFPHISKLRKTLIDQKVLQEQGDFYVLTQDYPFTSPSAASDVLLASSTSGLAYWKDKNGRTLKEIRSINTAES